MLDYTKKRVIKTMYSKTLVNINVPLVKILQAPIRI
uniref:Uncharacterized protein n=1 Tax=virus sp. ctBM815 TaxID=2825806 RepID=A0A8S5RJA1_9VIRU|nr:MAG TPA: hypothetical protein [virus sp. ctBM815]